jgi:hypothetical protein
VLVTRLRLACGSPSGVHSVCLLQVFGLHDWAAGSVSFHSCAISLPCLSVFKVMLRVRVSFRDFCKCESCPRLPLAVHSVSACAHLPFVDHVSLFLCICRFLFIPFPLVLILPGVRAYAQEVAAFPGAEPKTIFHVSFSSLLNRSLVRGCAAFILYAIFSAFPLACEHSGNLAKATAPLH